MSAYGNYLTDQLMIEYKRRSEMVKNIKAQIESLVEILDINEKRCADMSSEFARRHVESGKRKG